MMQAVLFDLDGTLADSAILTQAAFAVAAPEEGLPAPDAQAVRAAIGWANPEFYYKLYPDAPSEKVEALGVRVEALELAMLPELATDMLFAGVREMLQRLHTAGIRLFIASTGSAEHVDSLIDKAGIRCFFQRIYCGEPDKIEMVRRILAENELHSAIMVGDKKKDSDGARGAGIAGIGACWGYCRRSEDGFDCYVDSPAELAELVLSSAGTT